MTVIRTAMHINVAIFVSANFSSMVILFLNVPVYFRTCIPHQHSILLKGAAVHLAILVLACRAI